MFSEQGLTIKRLSQPRWTKASTKAGFFPHFPQTEEVQSRQTEKLKYSNGGLYSSFFQGCSCTMNTHEGVCRETRAVLALDSEQSKHSCRPKAPPQQLHLEYRPVSASLPLRDTMANLELHTTPPNPGTSGSVWRWGPRTPTHSCSSLHWVCARPSWRQAS